MIENKGLNQLSIKTRTGDAVHNSQKMGTEHGFKNVSQIWLNNGCMSYDDAVQKLAEGHAATYDIMASVTEMRPISTEDGQFVIQYKDGRQFRPTPFAIGQMANWSNVGTWFATSLLTNPEDAKGRQLYARDRHDAFTLVVALRNGFRRIDSQKQFLWRTNTDGTLRAMLSDKYAVIDNEWFMEALKKIIPGGLCSHWKGDSDTIYGNVLIPDSIRKEEDSDYGGMLSISNSEIGEREMSSLPSVFRAICMNGCIWDREMGEALRVRHRGNVDLNELFKRMKKNLDEQIPLLPQGIEKILGVRSFGWDAESVLPLMAQVVKQFKLSKKQMKAFVDAYEVERVLTPAYSKTLFGMVNGITRAGQKLPNGEWVRMDQIGGELVSYDRDDWNRLMGNAKSMKVKEVEETLALVA